MSAPTIHAIKIIQPAGLNIATVRVSPPRGEPGEPGEPGAAGADGEDAELPAWADLEGKPATFPPSSHTHSSGDITGLTESLATKADLVGGVIPTAQIPAIAITSYLGSVASQAAMLSLNGQPGDWCNRSDTSTAWVITGGTPAQLSSWAQISYPASPVTSVNGQSGVIVLGYAEVGAVPTAREISTSGLATGGGTLTTNRTIDVPIATSSDVMAGTSLVKAVTPLAARAAMSMLCSRVNGLTANVHGYTDMGTPSVPESPPDDLAYNFDPTSYEIYGIEGSSVTLGVNGNSPRRYYYAVAQEPGDDYWIDMAGISSFADAVDLLRQAIASDHSELSVGQPSSNQLEISGFSGGSASWWTATASGLWLSVSGEISYGIDGVDEVLPSGEHEMSTLLAVPVGRSTRIVRAWVEGSFTGAQARFAVQQGEEITPLGGWFSAPGELQPMDAPSAFFELPGGVSLVLQLSTPIYGASVDGKVIVSINS